jgi:hypothetical protein
LLAEKYNLSSTNAQFKEVVKIFNLQKKLTFKPADKLSQEVMSPDHYQKMKVKNHTKLYDSDVSSCIDFLNSSTDEIDNLFGAAICDESDSIAAKMSSTSFFLKCMDRWSSLTSNRQTPINLKDDEEVESVKKELSEFNVFFGGLRFDNRNKPCQSGAKMVNMSLSELIDFYREIGIELFFPGYFDTVPVENLFSVVRRVRVKPSCKEFTQQLRAEVCRRFTDSSDMTSYKQEKNFQFSKISFLEFLKGSNEEKKILDFDANSLEMIEKLNESLLSKSTHLEDTSIFYNELEINCFLYACAVMMEKFLQKVDCKICARILLDQNPIPSQFNKLIRIRKLSANSSLVEPSKIAFEYFLKLENFYRTAKALNFQWSEMEMKNHIEVVAQNVISFAECHCKSTEHLLMRSFFMMRINLDRLKRDVAKKNKFSSPSMAS